MHKITLFLCILFCLNSLVLVHAQDETEITVSLYNQELKIYNKGNEIMFDNKPFIDENGRSLVPVREFAKEIGYKVSWFESNKEVCISQYTEEAEENTGGAGGDSLWFTIGSEQYRINGEYYNIDTKVCIVNNKTYVPLRILCEAIGIKVTWCD